MKPFHSSELLELLEKYSERKMLPAANIDLSILNEMTFGDENVLRDVLGQFVKDSRHDLAILEVAIQEGNHRYSHEIMHRLAGRSGQIGAKELSSNFVFTRLLSVKKIRNFQLRN